MYKRECMLHCSLSEVAMLSRLHLCRSAAASSASPVALFSAARRLVQTFEAAPIEPRKPPRQTPNVMHGTRLATDPRWSRRMRQDLYRRRMLAGPEPERPRSAWSNWNRRVELSATLNRLGLAGLSGFTVEQLDRALTFPEVSAVAGEVSLEALSVTSDASVAKPSKNVSASEDDEVADSVATAAGELVSSAGDNADLVPAGRALIAEFCNRFLTKELPHVPSRLREQAVRQLTSDECLAYVSGHLGLAELLSGVDTRQSTLPLAREADAFAALVASAKLGGAVEGEGEEAAWRLTRDYLLTRLHDVDINEWWSFGGEVEAERLLSESLVQAGFPANEPLEYRLMRCSAPDSPVYACFQVGLYVRRELLSSGFGETPRAAQSECVSEALKTLFDTGDSRAPMNFQLALAELP